MFSALMIAAALSSCEDSYAAGAAAARDIEGLYHHRNGAVVLETRLSQAIADGEFETVCDDPVAFARAFSARVNQIGGGDIVRLRPTGSDYEDPEQNRLAAGESISWGITRADVSPSGAGHLRILDFYELAHAGPVIAHALSRLQDARALVISLDGAAGGETETALALYAALAPEAARRTRLNIETRYDYRPAPIAAPAQWPRLRDGLTFYIVVGEHTGPAARALATLLSMHTDTVLIGAVSGGAGGYVYETLNVGRGYELELAVGSYRLGGSAGWPSEPVRPDIPAASLSDALDRAAMMAETAARD